MAQFNNKAFNPPPNPTSSSATMGYAIKSMLLSRSQYFKENSKTTNDRRKDISY
jgi:hypothetical protein